MNIRDSFSNIVSGLGTDKDKMSYGQFTLRLLGKPEIDSMYEENWAAGMIIDAPCDDMTRSWRSWKAGKRQIAQIETEEKNHGIQYKLNRALKLGGLYGGGILLLGIRGQDPALELVPEAVKKGDLEFVHVLSRWEIGVTEIDRDPMSKYFGEPKMYVVSGKNGTEVRIHPSRVVRFLGRPRLEDAWSVEGWGVSRLARAYDAVMNFTAIMANAVSLTYEAKVDIVSIPQLNEKSRDQVFVTNLLARFALANRAKSVQNTLLLDEKETWNQKTATFAGLVDMITKSSEMLAAAAEMPQSRFLGRGASGLNASVDSEIRQWYDVLDGKRQTELDPNLARLDDVLVRSALGTRPDKIYHEWNPMWELTEAEATDISLKKAQRDLIYAQMGIMGPNEFRRAIESHLIESGTYPGLEQIIDEAGKTREAPAPLIEKPEPAKKPA